MVRIETLDTSQVLRQAGERWARCMDSRGHPSQEFTDVDRARRFIDGPEPTDAEIAVALADAECRAASGYTATRNGLIETGVRQWQAGNADVIAEVAAAIEREVAIAEQLLAGAAATE